MKTKILSFLTLIFVIVVQAQSAEPLQFTDVVKVSDSSKNAKVLYANAKMWFTQTFKNPKEVIVLDDPNNNIIVGRGNMRYQSKIFSGSAAREGWITFDVQISCKDGRYKYNFSNFIHEGHSVNYGLVTNEEFLPTMKGMMAGGPKNYKIKVTTELRETISNKVEALIESMRDTMSKNIDTKEDW